PECLRRSPSLESSGARSTRRPPMDPRHLAASFRSPGMPLRELFAGPLVTPYGRIPVSMFMSVKALHAGSHLCGRGPAANPFDDDVRCTVVHVDHCAAVVVASCACGERGIRRRGAHLENLLCDVRLSVAV